MGRSKIKKKKKILNYTDTEILTAIHEGKSDNVLTFLYKTVQPKITAWIQKNNGDSEEAQDVFQDAVIAFYRYVKTNRFKDGNSVSGFIFSVSKNLWINRVKQKSRTMTHAESNISNTISDEPDFVAATISREREEKIQEILSQLGERCKELLTYSIFHNLSMEDISEKMGFNNADTAKTKNYKCKQRLIKLVKENEHFKDFLYA